MNLLGFIFHIGIVFITFHFFWWVFMWVIKMLAGTENQRQVSALENFLKPVSLLILVAVSALKAFQMAQTEQAEWSIYVYAALGAILVAAYIQQKLQRGQLQVKIVNGRPEVERPTVTSTDKIMVVALSVLFVVFTLYPAVVTNPFTLWLSEAIHDTYETPVVGWIIGGMGILFLIKTFFMALLSIRMLMSKVPVNNARSKYNKYTNTDDGYTDYEIVDDDVEEDNHNSSNDRYIE